MASSLSYFVFPANRFGETQEMTQEKSRKTHVPRTPVALAHSAGTRFRISLPPSCCLALRRIRRQGLVHGPTWWTKIQIGDPPSAPPLQSNRQNRTPELGGEFTEGQPTWDPPCGVLTTTATCPGVGVLKPWESGGGFVRPREWAGRNGAAARRSKRTSGPKMGPSETKTYLKPQTEKGEPGQMGPKTKTRLAPGLSF